MAYLNPRILDFGLNVLSVEADRLDICTQEPMSFAEATVTHSKGVKTGLNVSSPADGAGTARKVTVAAILNGDVTGTAMASHWAISDTASGRLLAAGPLGSAQAVTVGNTFTLPAFDISLTGLGGA